MAFKLAIVVALIAICGVQASPFLPGGGNPLGVATGVLKNVPGLGPAVAGALSGGADDESTTDSTGSPLGGLPIPTELLENLDLLKNLLDTVLGLLKKALGALEGLENIKGGLPIGA